MKHHNNGRRVTVKLPHDELCETWAWVDKCKGTVIAWHYGNGINSDIAAVCIDGFSNSTTLLLRHSTLVFDDEVTKPVTDETDWRAWAENKPGYCPCGILRSQCSYH